jgi:hypothetical protein
MIKRLTLLAGAILSAAALASEKSVAVPAATCIGHHCAVVGGGPAFPAVAILIETGLKAPFVFHPALGIYCVVPPAVPLHPYAPLVSVATDLTVPFGPGISPAASLAEINFAGAGCHLAGAPFALEVDTFQMIPGAGPPIVVPTDNVGFSVQF